MPKVTPLPPRGHYLAHEVGRLAGVSGPKIGQWARNGYIHSSQSIGPPRVYSFQDVAEAMVVHELRERGAPYRDIKATIQELRDRYGGDWPLTRARLATSKGRILAEADQAAYDIAKRGWQQVAVEERDLDRIVGLLQRGGWAARQVPDLQHIEVSPDRLSGRPTIRGRRVSAEKVARLSSVKDGAEILREDYGLSEDEVRDAARWWEATSAYQLAA